MGLADALSREKAAHRKGFSCSVCKALDLFDDDDREALAEALADPLIYSTAISRALKAEGHDISEHSVQRHRRGGCVQR